MVSVLAGCRPSHETERGSRTEVGPYCLGLHNVHRTYIDRMNRGACMYCKSKCVLRFVALL